jgi:NADPH:quinone reductase-like Zn-dependent oxidoreductase
VVVPFALEAAVCALCVKVPGQALPGVPTPALGLPYPSLGAVEPIAKTLVVNGASSSVGSMVTQLASAAEIDVIGLAGARNFRMVRRCGAREVFDYADADVVEKVVAAVKGSGNEFVGVFDAVSTEEPYKIDLEILERLGGGHLACSHPPPAEVPENVSAGMIFGVDDIATEVWREYVTPALEVGKLLCLPEARVVGKGLEFVEEALKMSRAGVSATKLVVEL